MDFLQRWSDRIHAVLRWRGARASDDSNFIRRHNRKFDFLASLPRHFFRDGVHYQLWRSRPLRISSRASSTVITCKKVLAISCAGSVCRLVKRTSRIRWAHHCWHNLFHKVVPRVLCSSRRATFVVSERQLIPALPKIVLLDVGKQLVHKPIATSVVRSTARYLRMRKRW